MSTWVWWTPLFILQCKHPCDPIVCSQHGVSGLPSEYPLISRARFQKRSARDQLRYDPVILISRSHSTNADHDRLIRPRKYKNQTVYCQLNHDINHSLGNLELKITWSWLNKNVRLIISIHGVTMGGLATSFMSTDTRASWSVQCTHTVFAHDIQHGLDMP